MTDVSQRRLPRCPRRRHDAGSRRDADKNLCLARLPFVSFQLFALHALGLSALHGIVLPALHALGLSTLHGIVLAALHTLRLPTLHGIVLAALNILRLAAADTLRLRTECRRLHVLL